MYIYLQAVNEMFLRLKESNTITGILVAVTQPALKQSTTTVLHRSVLSYTEHTTDIALDDHSYAKDLSFLLWPLEYISLPMKT